MAKIGDILICPVCGEEYIKKHPRQEICTSLLCKKTMKRFYSLCHYYKKQKKLAKWLQCLKNKQLPLYNNLKKKTYKRLALFLIKKRKAQKRGKKNV